MNIPRSSQEQKAIPGIDELPALSWWSRSASSPELRTCHGCHDCHGSRCWSLPLGDRLGVKVATQELPCVWRTQGAWGQRNRGVSWKEPPRIAEWPFWNGGEVSLKPPSTPPIHVHEISKTNRWSCHLLLGVLILDHHLFLNMWMAFQGSVRRTQIFNMCSLRAAPSPVEGLDQSMAGSHFLSHGIPPNHPFFCGFPWHELEPSSYWGSPWLWKPPLDVTLRLCRYCRYANELLS